MFVNFFFNRYWLYTEKHKYLRLHLSLLCLSYTYIWVKKYPESQIFFSAPWDARSIGLYHNFSSHSIIVISERLDMQTISKRGQNRYSNKLISGKIIPKTVDQTAPLCFISTSIYSLKTVTRWSLTKFKIWSEPRF